jgi:dipeptidase D
MSSLDSIRNLEPQALWQRFYEISQIPRPSKKEEKITAHFEQMFNSLGIKYSKDKVGNLVARIPASKGCSKSPTIVLQGHSDMVCEKNRGTEHDFDHDPIELVRQGEWIRANGTTLGADNGIGVAAALAVMTDPNAVHGPLEILITIDEETGLTGANRLSNKMLKGKYLLNLDSEEDGIFYVGCAGGIDTAGILSIQTAVPHSEYAYFNVMVSGLKGGHSGGDIHLGKGNAIKLLARTLEALKPLKPELTSLEGGSKRNAIPREAEAVVGIPADQAVAFQNMLEKCARQFRAEYQHQDGGVQINATPVTRPLLVYSKSFAQKIISLLLALPHGVIQMSADLEGLVETSTNLATITTDGQKLTIGTSQRSSVDSAKAYIASSVASIFRLAGAKVEQSDGYPGWKPNLESHLLKVCEKAATQLYGSAPEIKAIHAGLECGILGGKYPELEMISFGPTITGAHSPDEQVHIPAVEKFYELLKLVLKGLV